jgi:hypothetical protein
MIRVSFSLKPGLRLLWLNWRLWRGLEGRLGAIPLLRLRPIVVPERHRLLEVGGSNVLVVALVISIA